MSELTDRLVEAAARAIYSDWAGGGAVPLESSALHHRYGTAAQAALAAVLPLLAEEIEAQQIWDFKRDPLPERQPLVRRTRHLRPVPTGRAEGEGGEVSQLSEFLLARITEDEARARRIKAAYDDEEHFWAPAAVVNAGALISPTRVLAECEAKRLIIRWMTDDTVMCEAADPILQALALPYADHPDFREEWRP